MYKIEKNIPVEKMPKRAVYPFGDMDVGDSFLVPDNSGEKFIVRSAAYSFTKTHNKKFKTKTMPCGGVRVWRVE